MKGPSFTGRIAACGLLLISWMMSPFPNLPTSTGSVSAAGAKGTLVVAVPTSSGIVVAADTRSTTMGVACDGDTKVAITNGADPILVATTGTATWVSARVPLWPDDPCGDLKKNGVTFFDAKKITVAYLEHKAEPLWSLQLKEVADRLLEEVISIYKSEPAYVSSFAGRTMFQIVLAAYKRDDATSYVQAFQLNLSSSGRITADLTGNYKFGRDSKPDCPYFGDTENYERYVINGSGKQFLPDSLNELKRKATVAEVSEQLAESVTSGMIEAAKRTQTIEPAFKSIGGPIEVFALRASGPAKLQ